MRWVINQKPEQERWKAVTTLKEREKELRLFAGRLRRRLLELEKELEITQLENLDKDMHTNLSISHSYSCSSAAKE